MPPPGRIDTHAASVFLAGETAWKLKRAVRFDYLDFSTPEKRRQALETELRLNRRTAPGLYRAVRSINRDANGALSIGGTGEPVDWLLEMRRFPDDARLDRVAARGDLDGAMLTALVDRIAAFHADAPADTDVDGAARMREIIDGNAESLAAFGNRFAADARSELIEAQRGLVHRHTALLDARAAKGRLRHVHGDLHLANIALIDGVPTPFDCLEFDARLATIDVLYDLAFLLMDLWQGGLRREANIVFNRYFDLTGEDDEAVVLMPLFLSVRATIRAHVLAAQAARAGEGGRCADGAARHFALAQQLLVAHPPRLVAIGGLSGTGKSTLARAIGGDFEPAPGARILRSDVIRKRLAGVAPDTRLSAQHYSREASARVYRRLSEKAATLIGANWCVIADAVFAQTEEREAIAAAAGTQKVAFSGFWLQTPVDLRVARVESRGTDASDADAAIARMQESYPLGEREGWTGLDGTQPIEELGARIRRHLRDKGRRDSA